MAGSHGVTSSLHHGGDSVVHRLPPEAKVVATVVFVLAVVATPREAVWAFALDAMVIAVVLAAARLPAAVVVRRLRIEVPFLAFAIFLAIFGPSPRLELVAGLSLSEPGLAAAWNLVVKGTLGVGAAIALAATTPVPELLRGLERLRVPRALTSIAAFMVRYLDVIVGEASRMRVARASRCADPRWLWQGRAFAASAGTLFVRSFERGERVHLAMVSRGFDGTIPELHQHAPAPGGWVLALTVPAIAVTALAVALGAPG